MMQYGELGDTFYFSAAVNDTTGSGIDGASAVCRVRLCGGAAGAAAIYSPTPTLLSHANHLDGSYEIAIAATAGNGFATNSTYSVWFTISADSENPGAFLGQFALGKALTAADLVCCLKPRLLQLQLSSP